jgi:hypothetical protein
MRGAIMFRKNEITIIILIGIFCFSTVWAEEQKTRRVTLRDPKTGKTVTKQMPVAPKESDPYENTSVLVEAFMVRVSTEALAEVGVKSIGQSPEGISILKILACLDDIKKAEVISGAKVNCQHNNESGVKKEDRIYIKRESGNSIDLEQYSSGKTFKVMPRIKADRNIRLEAAYSDLIIIENEDEAIPPTQINYDWNGVLVVKSGIPIIAGATQNRNSATILILTATIQD